MINFLPVMADEQELSCQYIFAQITLQKPLLSL